jgi:hypothetical protein
VTSVRIAWPTFAVLSFAAVATGCWVARAHGVYAHAWQMNLAAWAVGAGLAAALSRTGGARWWPIAAVAGLTATFLSSGMSGVHRWIGLGPVRLNSAEMLLPPVFAAGTGIVFPLAILILLALQPDASQAVAFAGGCIAAAMTSNPRRLWTAALLAAAAALSFLRADPLAPVPEVEGIVGLAASMSPALAALAMLTLAGTALTPLLLRSPAAYGFAAYLALSALAPLFGAFPVPLVGMGVSPILGAWLGFGALLRLARSPAPP